MGKLGTMVRAASFGRLRRGNKTGKENAEGGMQGATHVARQVVKATGAPGDVAGLADLSALPPLAGYLLKKHHSSKVRSWGKRWVQVDDLRQTVSYAKSEAALDKGAAEGGIFCLPLTEVDAVASADDEGAFCLRILASGNRTLVLRAADGVSRDAWLMGISQRVDRLTSAGASASSSFHQHRSQQPIPLPPAAQAAAFPRQVEVGPTAADRSQLRMTTSELTAPRSTPTGPAVATPGNVCAQGNAGQQLASPALLSDEDGNESDDAVIPRRAEKSPVAAPWRCAEEERLGPVHGADASVFGDEVERLEESGWSPHLDLSQPGEGGRGGRRFSVPSAQQPQAIMVEPPVGGMKGPADTVDDDFGWGRREAPHARAAEPDLIDSFFARRREAAAAKASPKAAEGHDAGGGQGSVAPARHSAASGAVDGAARVHSSSTPTAPSAAPRAESTLVIGHALSSSHQEPERPAAAAGSSARGDGAVAEPPLDLVPTPPRAAQVDTTSPPSEAIAVPVPTATNGGVHVGLGATADPNFVDEDWDDSDEEDSGMEDNGEDTAPHTRSGDAASRVEMPPPTPAVSSATPAAAATGDVVPTATPRDGGGDARGPEIGDGIVPDSNFVEDNWDDSDDEDE